MAYEPGQFDYFATSGGGGPSISDPATTDVPPAMAPTLDVEDRLAWAAVGIAAIFLVVALRASGAELVVVGVGLVVIQWSLLAVDRVSLARAGVVDPPGWGWVLVAPAYLFRRGRSLGHRPVYAHTLVAVGLLGRIAASVFGIGGEVLETTNLEQRLAAEHSAWRQETAAVECPDRVPARSGERFECVIDFPCSGRTIATFEVVDPAGQLRQTSAHHQGTSCNPT